MAFNLEAGVRRLAARCLPKCADTYVIFGKASFPATIDLNALGTAGIRIYGADANDRSGSSVSSAGDVNGDGFDDLLIGAFLAAAANNAKANAGESSVIFGAASLPSTINLNALSTSGITIFGVDILDRSNTQNCVRRSAFVS